MTTTKWKILHNPKCTTSRKVLDALQKKKVPLEIIEYLKTPLTEPELRALLKKAKLPASAIARKKETLYKEKNLGNKTLSEQDWITLYVQHPILIERPIVITDKTARIIRPIEVLDELFS